MKSQLAKIFAPAITAVISTLNIIPVSAVEDVCKSSASNEVKAAAGCKEVSGYKGDALPDVIINILNGIIAVSSFVAVVFVVIGGVQYMTSSGDANKTKKARDTILYACIGLVICVLAFAIVNFVIKNIIGGEPET